MKMDRTDVAFTDQKTIQEDDKIYWSQAPIEEKLEMITYLRECFYGPEATTGRLQRFFEFTDLKNLEGTTRKKSDKKSSNR